MKILGFKYERRRKSYYVDTHEKPENVRYRREFIKRYFKYEIRAYRWISISADERTNMVMEGKIEKDLGYEYKKEGKTYFKFHIDDHHDFQLKCIEC